MPEFLWLLNCPSSINAFPHLSLEQASAELSFSVTFENIYDVRGYRRLQVALWSGHISLELRGPRLSRYHGLHVQRPPVCLFGEGMPSRNYTRARLDYRWRPGPANTVQWRRWTGPPKPCRAMPLILRYGE